MQAEHTSTPSLGIIIVAAGSSQRMGFDKLMHPLNDKPVLQHSLDVFQHSELVSEVVLVCPPERFDQLEVNEKVRRCDGGAERHFSVLNGIATLSEQVSFIAVHDGARPLIHQEQLEAIYLAAQQHKAATSARRITETIKRGNEQEFTSESVSREMLWAMETPQIFSASLLKQAYKTVIDEGHLVTDEVSALEHIGFASKLIANPRPNPKITFPEDISIAELLLPICS